MLREGEGKPDGFDSLGLTGLWVVGPEAGTVFWNQGLVVAQYSAWADGEASDGGPSLSDDYAELGAHYAGEWNDVDDEGALEAIDG